jgi:hypothetical protein
VASGYAALSVLPANREVLTVILVGAVLIVAHVALLGLASLGRLPLAAVAGVLSVVA